MSCDTCHAEHLVAFSCNGVDTGGADGTLGRFCRVKAPTTAELNRLTRTIAARIGRFLQCNGLLEQDAENAYLTGDGIEPGPMDQLIGQPRPRVHLTRYHGVFAPTAESALR